MTQAQPLAAHGEIGNGRADESRGDNGTLPSRAAGGPGAWLIARVPGGLAPAAVAPSPWFALIQSRAEVAPIPAG